MNDIPALEIDHLSVNYDVHPVLWDVQLSVPQGKMVGIIGPNGAGKSTLLKAALGLVKPLSGKVKFFGKALNKYRNKIAFVPQRSSVDWEFPATVFDIVLMGCYGRLGWFRKPKKQDREAARLALDQMGMLAFADRQISQLSGGQQQRVFLARALVQDADIFLMDEPFAGVDAATEKAIIALLDQLKLQGKTLLIVHHDLNTVERYFDWLIILNTCLIAAGEVDKTFTLENIRRAYGHSLTILDEALKLKSNKSLGIQR